MMDLKRDWKFCVKADTLKGESVCLVGNCNELGGWRSSKSVLLSKVNGLVDNNIWSTVVSIPDNQELQFRYFIGVIIEPECGNVHKRQIIVRRWETHLNPRTIKKSAESNVSETAVVEIASFGFHDQSQRVERGWLTSETVIQLKLFNNALQLWDRRFDEKKVYLKVTPVNLMQHKTSDPFTESVDENMDMHDQAEPSDHWLLPEVAVMNEKERDLQPQQKFGQIYEADKFMLFHMNVHHPESVAYLVDLYMHSSWAPEQDPLTHVGFSYILPRVLKSSDGKVIVPFTSIKHHPIGQLTVEYLVIQPIADFDCDMSVSYARLWKQSWLGLDVGHRGLGTSFKPEVQACADVRENTIASLKTAAMHGADLVEFDVQLTKDLVPVIYHDFHVCIAMKRKCQLDEHDMLELPLKDLTLEQLQLLKVYHLIEGENKNPRFFDEHLKEHQPFPTLQQTLEEVDQYVGFNIEIKWGMELKDGTFELYHAFDLNVHLDIVLKVVLQYGGSRKIVFSCFHPDVCTMIRLKQNKFPVVFLTQGVTAKYPPYHDLRTQSIPMAVHFAVCLDILGINVHTEDLLRDSSQVKLVTDAGLIIFCWGDDNNSSSTIKHLKNVGLHAIIYDKIDKYCMKNVKESIFLLEARETQKDLPKVGQEVDQPQTPTALLSEISLDVCKTHETLSTLSLSATSNVGSACSTLCTNMKKADADAQVNSS